MPSPFLFGGRQVSMQVQCRCIETAALYEAFVCRYTI